MTNTQASNINKYVYTSLNHDDYRLKTPVVVELIQSFQSQNKQMYILDRLLVDQRKYSFDNENILIILTSGYKITLLSLNDEDSPVSEFREDFIEDLGSLSDNYDYKQKIGRPREWKEFIVGLSIQDIAKLSLTPLESSVDIRKVDLLISLAIGSINDSQKISIEEPQAILEKIKQKIILFDTDQTAFIYSESPKKTTRIQGLSGTGKTELLLHKLRELYTLPSKPRILLTCHNKILASDLRNRIPQFFDFMKVKQQIDWERLNCVHAWGSRDNPLSGAYKIICDYYDIPFRRFGAGITYEFIFTEVFNNLKQKQHIEKLFDFILIDESQDFPKVFFDLCEIISDQKIYIAGDIFQNIFDDSNILQETEVDFLLNKCYRTDPKTLMFGHAFSMKLFQKQKLRWLDDSSWEKCGYIINKTQTTDGVLYQLSREPIRRFEDIETSDNIIFESHTYDPTLLLEKVTGIIKNIKLENPTVQPEDIAIIIIPTFGDNRLYNFMSLCESFFYDSTGFDVNIAYTSKQREQGKIFISNVNNVKGLEFPFVICLSNEPSDSFTYRNSVYMATTRSLMKTFFILTNNSEKTKQEILQDKTGLYNINKHLYIECTEPSPEMKEAIQNKIKQANIEKSLSDYIIDIYNNLKLSKDQRSKIKPIVRAFIESTPNPNREHLHNFIVTTAKSMDESK